MTMTDLEQRLRLVLHQQSGSVRVTPRLRHRLDARIRSSGRFRSRVVVACGAAGLLAVGVVLWIVAGTRVVRDEVTGPAPQDSYFAGYWPVSTRAEAEAMQDRVDDGEETWRRDPRAVARAYGESLGWIVADVVSDDHVREGLPEGATAVVISPSVGEGKEKIAGPDHVVSLISLEGRAEPVWFVAGIESTLISVEQPSPGEAVGRTFDVAGTAHTFEGNVVITVLDDAGDRLARTNATGGASDPAPFRASVTIDRARSSAGIITFEGGGSGIGGRSTDLTVIRVRFDPKGSASPGSVAPPVLSDEFADEAFRCIVDARHHRDMQMAEPCMTRRWASISDPVEFVGASSPAFERSTIVSSARDGGAIVYDVRSYWGRTDALEFVSEDIITIVLEDGEWRADGWTHGDLVRIEESTRVELRFLELGDTPRCDGQTPAPESFVSVERLVPTEPVIDDLALSVTRELITGVFSHEGDGTGVFSSGARVTRVSVTDGIATVELNRVDPPLDRCDFAREALRQTLTRLSGITGVELRQATAQASIEPDA
jgi:hypothetical protein